MHCLEPLYVDKCRLFCGKYVFEQGDEVVISSKVVPQDYLGTIISVTCDAIYLQLTSGQKVCVQVDLIQHMRCDLKPFLRGESALESLQTTGWAKCEPF
jgi:hypothetical protein